MFVPLTTIDDEPYCVALQHIEAVWSQKGRHFVRTVSGDVNQIKQTPDEVGELTGAVMHTIMILRQIGLI